MPDQAQQPFIPASGLQPLTPDKRDRRYRFARHFGAAKLSGLPDFYTCDAGLLMQDQNAMGLPTGCTAVTQTDLATDQDGVEYTPEYTFAQTLRLMGVPANWGGADLRKSLKSVIAYGLLERWISNVTAQEIGQEGAANWRIWLPYEEKAIPNAKSAYMDAKGGTYDAFDNIRSTLWLNREKRMGVSIGTPWYPQWSQAGTNGIVPNVVDINLHSASTLGWHNWAIKGWKTINGTPYLIAKVWAPKHVGDRGWLYFDRDTINRVLAVEGTGAYTIAEEGNRFVFLLGTMLESFPQLLPYLPGLVKLFTIDQTTNPTPAPAPEPHTPPELPQKAPALLWDTPEQARHSARVIMDEEGITHDSMTIDGRKYRAKDVLCAVIQGESGFKRNAKNENKDPKTGKVMSTDWGLCQINDWFHIGPGKRFASVEQVLNQPELSVRFMVRCYKGGRLYWWIAYKNGSYKKYL